MVFSLQELAVSQLAPELVSFQDCVDCLRCLAIVFAEQVSVNPQGDIRLGVTEPLADGDDIDVLVDQLAGVSVPQCLIRLMMNRVTDVRFWHKADIPSYTAHVRLGG
jgi:hypothetical protein